MLFPLTSEVIKVMDKALKPVFECLALPHPCMQQTATRSCLLEEAYFYESTGIGQYRLLCSRMLRLAVTSVALLYSNLVEEDQNTRFAYIQHCRSRSQRRQITALR